MGGLPQIWLQVSGIRTGPTKNISYLDVAML
jgi:hypothetical protein